MNNHESTQLRYHALISWAQQQLSQPLGPITLLSGDASFRRYFRLSMSDETRVLVDADPTHEDNPSFVKIATALKEVGSHVPEVFAVDYEQGFMLLSDLGDEILQPLLNDQSLSHYYQASLVELERIQSTQCDVPNYDRARLLAEMQLFDQWFLARQLNIDSPDFDLNALYEKLIDSALDQPQVFVHRDYHSRNLLSLSNGYIGVLDFQDAVIGPITYDLVSLLRDCYIAWPLDVVESYALQFKQSVCPAVDDATFLRWFDWMGLQRHLKCVGIFTRLNCRDNKPNYLADIPRVLNYLVTVAEKYPELTGFSQFLIEIQEQYLNHEGNDTRRGTWQTTSTADG